MLFLLVMSVFMAANTAAFLRWHKSQPLAAMVSMAAAGCAAIGFMVGLVQPEMVSPDAINWTAPCLLIASLLSLSIHPKRLTTSLLGHDTSPAHWRSGITCLLILCSIYLLAAVIDHYWFLRDRDRIGVVFADLENVPKLCDNPYYFRLNNESASATFRCPQIILGPSFGSTPFMPLGTYTTGESIELRREIVNLSATSQHVGTDAQADPYP